MFRSGYHFITTFGGTYPVGAIRAGIGGIPVGIDEFDLSYSKAEGYGRLLADAYDAGRPLCFMDDPCIFWGLKEWSGADLDEMLGLDVRLYEPKSEHAGDAWLLVPGRSVLGRQEITALLVGCDAEEVSFAPLWELSIVGEIDTLWGDEIGVGGAGDPWFRLGEDPLEEPEPPVILGLVPGGSLNMFYGLAKEAGKSRLLRASIRAVLLGALFLGRRCAEEAVVMLTEEPRRRLERRLWREGFEPLSGLSVIYGREHEEEPWEWFVAEIEREVASTDAKLVIVDTLGFFVDLRSSASVEAAIRSLGGLAERGVAVIFALHERKSGGSISRAMRGRTSWTGLFDNILRLQRLPGKPLDSTLRRLTFLGRDEVEDGGLPPELTIELVDHDYVILNGEGGFGGTRPRAADLARPMVLAVLTDAPPSGLTDEELREQVRERYEDAPSKTPIREARDALIEEGLVVVLEEHSGKRPARYALAPA